MTNNAWGLNDSMNAMNDVFVLVDISYYMKYSANAAWRKLKSVIDVEDNLDCDPMIYPEFKEYLSGYFNHNISSIVGRHYPMHNHACFYFCTDCQRKDIWRKDWFSGYKHKRDTIVGKFNYDGINSWVSDWMKLHNTRYNSKTIGINYAEADDIIAILSQQLVAKFPENDVLILSGDSDLLQLGNNQVFQIDAFGELQTIEQKLSKDKVSFEPTPNNYLIYKVLCGDSSDDIPSVKRGRCGPKMAAKLINDSESLTAYIKSEKEISEAFVRNHKLISLNSIPKLIVENILGAYYQL